MNMKKNKSENNFNQSSEKCNLPLNYASLKKAHYSSYLKGSFIDKYQTIYFSATPYFKEINPTIKF